MNAELPPRQFAKPFPAVLRVFLAGLGAAAIILPALQLHSAIIPFNALSPFFGIIVAGSIGVGCVFVAGAVRGQSFSWVLGDGQIEVVEKTAFRSRRHTFTRSDVRTIFIETTTWDNGPDTFEVVLDLNSGARLSTASCPDRNAAL